MREISDKLHVSAEMYYFNSVAFLAHYTLYVFRASLRFREMSFCSNEIYCSGVSH